MEFRRRFAGQGPFCSSPVSATVLSERNSGAWKWFGQMIVHIRFNKKTAGTYPFVHRAAAETPAYRLEFWWSPASPWWCCTAPPGWSPEWSAYTAVSGWWRCPDSMDRRDYLARHRIRFTWIAGMHITLLFISYELI